MTHSKPRSSRASASKANANAQSKLNLLKARKGSVTPYFLGWILGVPTSVLVLVFLVRGCV